MAVLALLGAVLLVPLALAWVSANPRRWTRVERVLGREPKARPYPPRWLPWALIGGGAGYLATAIAMARDRDTPSLFPFWALTGTGYVLAGVIHLVARQRQKRKVASDQPPGREPSGARETAMSLGFMVLATAIGPILLAPLALAWASADRRRWARVERVLGRDLGRQPSWVGWGTAIALSVTLFPAGIYRLVVQGDRDPSLGLLAVTQGLVWAALVGFSYLRWRRERASSVQAQVEDRTERGSPAAGGQGSDLENGQLRAKDGLWPRESRDG